MLPASGDASPDRARRRWRPDALVPCAARGEWMLDRLISGAGALTDGADRSVRAVSGGSRSGFASTGPGSLLVVALLVVLAGLLILAGLEATDPSTPVSLAPAEIAASRTLGDRTYSTIHGALSSTYAEYFSDDNANGVEDAGEAG